MTYKIRGEAEVGIGLGLPRHTTISRLAYTPPSKGYTVYDTDTNSIFAWNDTSWVEWTTKEYVDSLQVSSLILAFQGTQQDATQITTFPVNATWLMKAASTEHRALVQSAPSGAAATWTISKNGAIVGNLSIANNATTGSVVFTSDTTYVPGDVLSIHTVSMSGAVDLSLTFEVFKL